MNPRYQSGPTDNIRINHRIRAREVRVIGADGTQLGVMETRRALDLANQQGLDLAEISPTSNPPVCKILDYGKYKYQNKKKAKQAKKNQTVTVLKEVQFRPQTDIHDIEFKVKHIIRFLSEGNKVKVSVRFRGREASHADLGHVLLKQIIDMTGTAGSVEQTPRMEGKILSIIFAPAAKAAKKPSEKAEKLSAKPQGGTAAEKAPKGEPKAKVTTPAIKPGTQTAKTEG